MTPKQLLLALRARWLLLAMVLAACLGLGASYVLFSKRQYTVNAAVMLDMKTADPIGGAVIPALGIGNYIATQADLIRSARVVQRAIKAQGMDKDPELSAAWQRDSEGQGDPVAWLAEQLLKRSLVVTPSRESNIITIAYTDSDPTRARDFLNVLLQAYTSTTIDMRTEAASRNNEFFESTVRQLRDNLTQAQERLTDQQREAGVLVNDERLDVENARLAELSAQLLALQVAEGDSGSRQRVARGQMDSTQEALSNPLISSMTADLAKQEARLGELRVRLGDQHPEVTQASANIATLKTKLDDELRRLGNSLRITNNVQATRIAQLRQAYEAQREKVARFKALRDRTAVLQRDVENANQAYSATLARARQSGMESQAALTNVDVVMAPTLPSSPSKPRALLIVVFSTLAGLVLGTGAALLRELLDRRLRSDDDVALLLGQRLIGQLPHDRNRSPLALKNRPGLVRLFQGAAARPSR